MNVINISAYETSNKKSFAVETTGQSFVIVQMSEDDLVKDYSLPSLKNYSVNLIILISSRLSKAAQRSFFVISSSEGPLPHGHGG